MYFTDSEAGTLCDNIRRVLEKKGGCWYTADVECSLQYMIVMRPLVGDHSAFWKITPNGTAVVLPPTETEGFHVDASIQDGTLSLVLAGRFDTITAPSLLSFFERTKAGQSVDAVDVDCGRLDYISSAGLRVLLIMHKACKDGVSLHDENEVVSEILSQTGFDSIFH
jgi:anti-anti-sigma factor